MNPKYSSTIINWNIQTIRLNSYKQADRQTDGWTRLTYFVWNEIFCINVRFPDGVLEETKIPTKRTVIEN